MFEGMLQRGSLIVSDLQLLAGILGLRVDEDLLQPAICGALMVQGVQEIQAQAVSGRVKLESLSGAAQSAQWASTLPA